MKNTVVIVDPMSTGKLYASVFHSLGYDCIALISRPDLPDHLMSALKVSDFAKVIEWSADSMSQLKEIGNVVAVVAGCETAIHLADTVAEGMGLIGNAPTSSDARRDKFVMQNALRAQGLAHIPSFLFASLDKLRDIDQLQEYFGPGVGDEGYVVKPINSAATDGVVFAADLAAVEVALKEAKWNKVNDLGEINKGFIVQPFISGPEYVVDMVAFKGEYVVATVCLYKKMARNGRHFVYNGLDILSPNAPELAELVSYAKSACKALEVNVGAVHMELIMSKKGPVMIEAGARLHGGIAPELFRETYQPDLLSLSAQSYLGTSKEKNLHFSELTRFGKIGFLFNDVEEAFKSPEASVLGELKQDPSYCGHRYFVQEGDLVPITIDFATCPGIFWVAHHDEKQLEISEHKVRQKLWGHESLA